MKYKETPLPENSETTSKQLIRQRILAAYNDPKNVQSGEAVEDEKDLKEAIDGNNYENFNKNKSGQIDQSLRGFTYLKQQFTNVINAAKGRPGRIIRGDAEDLLNTIDQRIKQLTNMKVRPTLNKNDKRELQIIDREIERYSVDLNKMKGKLKRLDVPKELEPWLGEAVGVPAVEEVLDDETESESDEDFPRPLEIDDMEDESYFFSPEATFDAKDLFTEETPLTESTLSKSEFDKLKKDYIGSPQKDADKMFMRYAQEFSRKVEKTMILIADVQALTRAVNSSKITFKTEKEKEDLQRILEYSDDIINRKLALFKKDPIDAFDYRNLRKIIKETEELERYLNQLIQIKNTLIEYLKLSTDVKNKDVETKAESLKNKSEISVRIHDDLVNLIIPGFIKFEEELRMRHGIEDHTKFPRDITGDRDTYSTSIRQSTRQVIYGLSLKTDHNYIEVTKAYLNLSNEVLKEINRIQKTISDTFKNVQSQVVDGLNANALTLLERVDSLINIENLITDAEQITAVFYNLSRNVNKKKSRWF